MVKTSNDGETIEELLAKLSRLQVEQAETVSKITQLRLEESTARSQTVIATDTSFVDSTITELDDVFRDIASTTSTASARDEEVNVATPYRPSADEPDEQYRFYYPGNTSRRKSKGDKKPPQRNIRDKFIWKPAPNNKSPEENFRKGTRVYITNQVTPKKQGVIDDRDRRGTVTHIEYRRGETRVHFVTDNNFYTWRFPKYLGVLLPDKE